MKTNEFIKNLIRKFFPAATSSLILVFILFGSSRCNPENDVLASFDGGDVKRWELQVAMKSSEDQQNKAITKDDMIKIVKWLALIKISALEGEKLGLSSTNSFKKLTAMQEEIVQIEAYTDYLRKKQQPLNFQMMEFQHLFLTEHKDSAGNIISRQKEVEEILEKLNSGKMDEVQLERFIVEKTEDPLFQSIAGYEIPVCINCVGVRKDTAIITLQSSPVNKFVKLEKSGVGVWISRKIQERTIIEDSLRNYYIGVYMKRNQMIQKYFTNIKDEHQRISIYDKYYLNEKQILSSAEEATASLLKTEKKRNPLDVKMEELKQKVDFKMENTILFHGEKKMNASEVKENTVIYSIGTKVFTYGDLKKRFPSEIFELNEQLKYVGKLVEYDILLHDNEFRKMVDSNFYKMVLKARRSRAFADTYMFEQHRKNPLNTEENTKSPLDELEKKYNLNILSSKIDTESTN